MVRTTSVLRGTGKTGRPSSQDMSAAGTLLEAGGLAPGAKGARVPVSREKMTVTDGPFTETKELTGGFAILKASSLAEAIEPRGPVHASPVRRTGR